MDTTTITHGPLTLNGSAVAVTGKNIESTSRLIAAAPTLLEAARATVDRLSAWQDGARVAQQQAEIMGDSSQRNIVENYEALLGPLRAAIAAAEGSE